MNKFIRIEMVKAMEYIAMQINRFEIYDEWRTLGIADNDINYGDLSVEVEDEENLKYYISDDKFKELMNLFLRVMSEAKEDGGLECDEVVS